MLRRPADDGAISPTKNVRPDASLERVDVSHGKLMTQSLE
jgi:hypothetical protein